MKTIKISLFLKGGIVGGKGKRETFTVEESMLSMPFKEFYNLSQKEREKELEKVAFNYITSLINSTIVDLDIIVEEQQTELSALSKRVNYCYKK